MYDKSANEQYDPIGLRLTGSYRYQYAEDQLDLRRSWPLLLHTHVQTRKPMYLSVPSHLKGGAFTGAVNQFPRQAV